MFDIVDSTTVNHALVIDENALEINGKVKMDDRAIASIKNALDYGDVIIKCVHCSQWGAVKTACKHCGAPIG